MFAKRWFRLTVLAGVVTIGVVAALAWWQDRDLQVAEQRLAAKNAAAALAAVDGFLERNPNHSPAIRLRARALVELGKAEEAVRLFSDVGADQPQDLQAWYKAHMFLGQFPQALQILESLQRVQQPATPEALEALTVCQYQLGMRDAAVASARRLSAIAGYEATGHLQLALLYRDWGALDLASEEFEKVLTFRPDLSKLMLNPAEFYLAYGATVLNAGKTQKALELFQQSEKVAPSPDAVLFQAEAWHALGDDDKAYRLMEQVVRQNPGHPASSRLAELARQRDQAQAAKPSPAAGSATASAAAPSATSLATTPSATTPSATTPSATTPLATTPSVTTPLATTLSAAPPLAAKSPANPASARPAAAVDATVPADGHARMLVLLEEIRQKTATENPFLGDAPARELERQLASLPQNADVATRFNLLNQLGMQQLQLGETEGAIQRFSECLKLVPKEASDLANRVEYQLSVAYLRLAENQNCVHCTHGEGCILPIAGKGVHEFRTGSEKAIQHLTAVLLRSPDHVVARWLLNLAYMTLGGYPQDVPEQFLIPREKFNSEEPFPRFVNIAQQLKLDETSLAGGMVVDDLNGDGRLDVVTSQWSTAGQLRCYLAREDGSFSEATEQAGLSGLYGGLNLVQADYDNDGDVDILVLRGGWWGEAGCHPKSLLANDGRGNFRDVTFEVGLGEVHYPTQTASWADYDNDGDLDLYVGNEEYPCQLFQNNGLGRFKDVAQEAGVVDGGYAKGVVWGDYDNDRYPDLYVSNLAGSNFLFHNNRDGTFTNVAAQAGVESPSRSFPTWFWDFNNDGNLDLFVAAYTSNMGAFTADYLGLPHQGETDRLYEGDGKGGFRDVSRAMNVSRVTVPMGSNFGDVDNDGYLDFYLGTGDPNFDTLIPNRLYHNQGGKRFADVSTASGLSHLQKGHGVAFADFDQDGDQDVFIEIGGAYPGDAFPNAVFENPGFGNHWLAIKLVGETSNRLGAGARIRAVVEEPGGSRSIYRWLNSGGSFGASPLRVHLGLGTAKQIKTLEVYWPTSDTKQVFDNVPADQFISITEGRDQWEQFNVRK